MDTLLKDLRHALRMGILPRRRSRAVRRAVDAHAASPDPGSDIHIRSLRGIAREYMGLPYSRRTKTGFCIGRTRQGECRH